jgi:AraC family transcriptional regulator
VAIPCGATTAVDTILTTSRLVPLAGPTIPRGGVLVERRVAPPLGREEVRLDYHYLLAWEQSPAVTEQAYSGNRTTRVTKIPGSTSLGLAGDLVPVRFHTRFQVIACLFDPILVQTLIDEAEQPNGPPLHAHCLSEDKALATLVRLLADEAETDGSSGQLYADSLSTAIMSRFVANARMTPIQPMGTSAAPLPTVRLRRVVDRMGSDLSEDLSLETLARESGYSRAHFIRMFSAATGTTPHRYLTEMRLEFARHLLESGVTSITEISQSAGFSSHSHLTKVFHARFGATPSEYRRAFD